ncbi:acetyltransferase [Pontibacter fetidus]|uniref:Acetyltransferase n=1 Tax=Pontibacter fetidus TaxID=2700082 RepID=A0A6B2GZ03_9BACT|nr:acetyltransferase [Pontibacter fetidus]NDK56219.1 acetyltransferase [Pontibacter fetidus]
MNKIAIFGAGGLGREVAMLIEQINSKKLTWDLIGFFDDGLATGDEVFGYKVIGNADDLKKHKSALSVVFAIGEPTIKQRIISVIHNPNLNYPVLIHPGAVLGKDVVIGEGTIIMAGNIITVNVKIGKHVLLSSACTVGHDVTLGACTAVMPGANISGNVEIGQCVYLGVGAKTIQQVKIGTNAIVGAGAVVINSIPPDCTAVGVPAKVIKKNNQ